jgi:hypothetical protein
MADVPLNVNIGVHGHQEVARVMRGLQETQMKSQKQLARERLRAKGLREQELIAERSALRSTVAAVRAAEGEKANLYRRTGRELYDSIATQTKKAVQASRNFLRQHRGDIARGLALGAVYGARSAVERGRGFLGLPSQQEAFSASMNYRTSFGQFAAAAGLSQEQSRAMMKRFERRSERTGFSEAEQLEGAREIQAKMGGTGLPAYEANLDTLTGISQSFGVPMDALAGVLVELQRQFNIAAEDLPEAIGFMVQAANEGSIEVGDFALEMRDSMGIWSSAMGEGIDSWKGFVSTAETIGTTISSSETSTAIVRALESLIELRAGTTKGDKDRQRLAKKLGLDLTADPLTIARQMRERGVTEGQLLTLFPETRASRAFRALQAQGGLGERLQALPGAGGLSLAEQRAQQFRQSPEGQIFARREEILRNVNQQFAEVADAADQAAGSLLAFASAHVVATQRLGVAFDALQAAGIGAIAWKALRPAKAATDVALTTGAAAAGGGAAATALGLLGAVVAPALVAGGVGAGLGKLTEGKDKAIYDFAQRYMYFDPQGKMDPDAAPRSLQRWETISRNMDEASRRMLTASGQQVEATRPRPDTGANQ